MFSQNFSELICAEILAALVSLDLLCRFFFISNKHCQIFVPWTKKRDGLKFSVAKSITECVYNLKFKYSRKAKNEKKNPPIVFDITNFVAFSE